MPLSDRKRVMEMMEHVPVSVLLAAEDMLAALRQAEHCIDETTMGGRLAGEMVRAAISKATDK